MADALHITNQSMVLPQIGNDLHHDLAVDLVVCRDIAHQFQVRQFAESQRERDSLSRKRSLIEAKHQRLLDLYLGGRLSKADYTERSDSVAANLRELEQTADEFQRVPSQIDETTIRVALDSLKTVDRRFDRLTPADKREFLRLVIDKVTYDWRKTHAVVRFHLPLGQGASSPPMARVAGGVTPAKRDNVLSFNLEVAV